MKDKDVHNLIEEQDKEKKAAMYAKFQEKHNLTSSKNKAKDKKKKIYFATCTASALILIFLIIAIPLLINNNMTTKRYCYARECVEVKLDCTIKDYAIKTGKSYLYIDWYDLAEDVESKIYLNKDDSKDVIYYNETIVNGETGDIVHLYVVDKFTDVDMLTLLEEGCDKQSDINATSVSWNYRSQQSLAVFQYGEYKYYIQLDDPIDQETILNIVEEMISK